MAVLELGSFLTVVINVEFEGNGFRIEIYPLMRVVQIKDNYLIFDLLI